MLSRSLRSKPFPRYETRQGRAATIVLSTFLIRAPADAPQIRKPETLQHTRPATSLSGGFIWFPLISARSTCFRVDPLPKHSSSSCFADRQALPGEPCRTTLSDRAVATQHAKLRSCPVRQRSDSAQCPQTGRWRPKWGILQVYTDSAPPVPERQPHTCPRSDLARGFL